jgi:hypothetical protein
MDLAQQAVLDRGAVERRSQEHCREPVQTRTGGCFQAARGERIPLRMVGIMLLAAGVHDDDSLL